MFRRKNQTKVKASVEPFTYIHHGTVLEGDLYAQGRVRVHGTVRGNLTVEGVLEVAENGQVEGETVKASEVKILGQVRANVEASGKIEIWSKGKLEGNVRAAALDIEEGALFSGRSEMRPAADAALGEGEQAVAVLEPNRLRLGLEDENETADDLSTTFQTADNA